MEPEAKRFSLEDFLKDLDAALDWLGVLGIARSHTRFSKYRSMLVDVFRLNRFGSIDELRKKVPPDDYRMALVEASDLIDIWRAFHRWRSERFKQKLREAVTGVVDPADENAESSPRDFLFELTVAAFFRMRRDPVLVGTHKDLVLRMDQETFFSECKRPKAESSVPRMMRRATKQIIGHFASSHRKTAGRMWGFIAIDISILANPGRLSLKLPGFEAINNAVDSCLIQFTNRQEPGLSYIRDSRIVGVLLFLKLLAFDTLEHRYVNCRKISMFCHAQERTAERAIADRLYNRLMPLSGSASSPG